MTLLPIHIIAGLIGLVSGAVALSANKGAKLHRRSGMIFVYAILVLSASGAVMTALLTVRRRGQGFRWMDAGAQPPVESAHRS